MGKYNIVITDNLNGNCNIEKRVLSSIDANVEIYKNLQGNELIEAVKNADGILVDMADISAEVIQSMNKCKVISRYGAGYDNVDIVAAKKAGIKVTIVPDYCIHEVAEHAFALLLSYERNIAQRVKAVSEGRWRDVNPPVMKRIYGSTLGIIGYGRTGKALHKLASGFGFENILIYSHSLEEGKKLEDNSHSVGLNELYKRSDYISLHLPLNSETNNFIDQKAFREMKNDSVLINTSRGGILNEDHLLKALQEGQIRGAAIDVMVSEPPSKTSGLLSLDNLIITDHKAYYSEDSIESLKEKCSENVISILEKGKAQFEV